ncbi:MAG: T9SS type A sorting domain-containing protein [Ignavibacteria bacterium]|nr:T9SS type A sorting domain-containing protein [Ignavibacteria bacterium]MBT8382262.1 T9SS type A sorting domain-containing protein [Ignavibacteria bacterium]MBT8390935.1 T9SS type A sorting domain-containing protein [Ignavibacteria bacterium]NNJ51560.1 T9SS type A sorting domain-containing protein [Ignavibacteriaceae bacterium]NNL19951.1 T9SS type A sorting domain-containing protein [Ignavibacteriaceae bacterium]
MFKSTHFFFFAVLLFAGLIFTANAQDITVNPNPVYEQQGQVPLNNNTDAITITHSATQTITSGNSVSCNAGGLHTDNSYFRAFDLNSFGITNDFNITEVSIGIETCTGAGGTQPITVNLWTSSQPFPTGFPGSVTQIGTATLNVSDQTLTVFPIAVTGTAPAGSELVVEIFTPDGQTAGNSFFIGSNADGETGPSYLLAADCGITTPTTTGTIGFPNMHIVMNVTGDEAGSGGGAFPEVIYYQFDETGGTQTPNLAVPGSGGAFGVLEGDVTMGGSGQFGAALVGSGSNGTINNVNTGWVPDLGTSDWTISMYLNNLPAGTALNYLFGETNTGSNFRCFYSGAAGEFAVLLRTGTLGGTDVTVPGVGPGPSVLTFVYDQTGPSVLSYINGVLVLTTPQAGTLTMTGSGTDFFRVGGHNGSSSGGLPVGSLMDEFRFYNRALDSAEVADTWNIPIPVELTSFTASVGGQGVTLDWETATETNNSGFAIERKSVTSDFVQIGFVAGFGTTTEPKAYTFTDNSLTPGTYSYRLKQIDYDGTYEYSDVVEVDVLAPDVYTLAQNYPNPFNPSTKIAFSLAVDSKVSLKIFDVLGQEVATLVNQDLTAGVYNYDFNATGINSGVYFYKIEAVGVNGNEFVDIKKMMLLK